METKAPTDSPAFTGTPTAPTPATSDDSTKIATTAYTANKMSDALSSSPVLGGSPTCTTQAWNNDSTRIASTAFVQDAVMGRCIVYANRTSDLSGGDVLTLVWDNEVTDTYSAYDTSNGRITPPWTGWYYFNMGLYIEATWGSTSSHANVFQLFKDGSALNDGSSLSVLNLGLCELYGTYLYGIGSYDTQPVYLLSTSYYNWVSQGTSGRSTHVMKDPSYIRLYYIGSSLTDF
jgi:hypothetical protein